MKYAVGIDPGLSGGLAIVDESKNITAMTAIPIRDSDVATDLLWDYILEKLLIMMQAGVDVKDIKIYVEKQHIRSAQKGAMKIGTNYGRILAVLELLELNIVQITPQAWKSSILKNVDKDKTGEKDRSTAYCQEMEYNIPTLNPTGQKLHHGIADAVCIALYGWKVDSDL